MKKTIKKLLSLLLALCLVLQWIPAMGFAVSADEADVQHTVYVPAEDLPGNDELFAMYVEQQLFGSSWTTFGPSARVHLNAAEQGIYDALKSNIEAVAANGGSTEFVLSEVEGLKLEWTREELGVESIEDPTEAQEQFEAQFDARKIILALLSDCPYDLYWYDKTEGSNWTYSMSRSGISSNGTTYWTKLMFKNLTFYFTVATAYQGTEAGSVTTDVSKVTTARNRAQAIADAHADENSYQKLISYKDEICSLVSYNDEAADSSYTGGYGDPWQLIYVFDGDAATEVVCEGYAKAFQHLCNLSGLDSIIVTGVMAGGTGAGGHMWNIVTLDGANYLVDVTNCDTGTIGAPDKLFLVGNASGSVSGGYSYTIGSQTISFTYDNATMATWTEGELTLAASDYEYVCSHTGGSPTCAQKAICELCGEEYGDYVHPYVNGFCTVCDEYEPCEGAGSADGPYLIANAGNLYWFMNVVNGGYGDVARNLKACGKLTADIVVNENVLAADGSLNEGSYRSWTPIGHLDTPFYGNFDGDGFTVSGLYFDVNNSGYRTDVGFIGAIEGGTVENLTVADSCFVGASYVGGIVGTNVDGVINNCHNAATVSGRNNVGGVVGAISPYSSVFACTNSGVISGSDSVGGVVGYAFSPGGGVAGEGTVASSHNTGAVSGSQYVGGVVGNNENRVASCYNTGVISGIDVVGGVVGINNGTVTGCYSTGSVSGSNEVGGVVGINNATVTNCYFNSDNYDGAAIGEQEGTVTVENVKGKTTAQFEAGEIAALLGAPFGQNIDNGGENECVPVFSDAIVYQLTDCSGAVIGYSNTETPAADHNYESEVTAPTCTEGGYTTYTCTVCGDTYTADETAPLGHTEETVSGKEATCTETGLTEGVNCSTCGEVLTAQEEIPAIGHSFTLSAGNDPTCTEDGYEEYACSNCWDSSVTYRVVVPALGHTEETVSGKEATCTETGLTEGVNCSTCGEVLTAQEEIPAIGHSFTLSAGNDPTCTEDGYEEYACSNCWDSSVTYRVVVPALGHTEETVPGKAATCTETGLTEGVNCSTCGEVLTAQEEIPAIGHSFEVCKDTDPTCTEDGLEGYACVRCWDPAVEYIVVVPALGHSYENGVCSVCGDVSDAVLNTVTGAVYKTLAEALKTAAEGETVQLLRDCVENRVMVFPGVTLDMNGFALTSDYLVSFDSAHVIDGVGTGRLVIGEQDMVLDESNVMVPVYDGEGYIFTKAGFAVRRDNTHTGEGIRINAVAYPVRMDVVELLKNGSADNNIQIMILLSWDTDEGTGSQEFVFTDDVVAAVYSSNNGTFAGYSKMFSMVITGFGNIENLRADMVIVSGTDVEYVSSNGIVLS